MRNKILVVHYKIKMKITVINISIWNKWLESNKDNNNKVKKNMYNKLTKQI